MDPKMGNDMEDGDKKNYYFDNGDGILQKFLEQFGEASPQMPCPAPAPVPEDESPPVFKPQKNRIYLV